MDNPNRMLFGPRESHNVEDWRFMTSGEPGVDYSVMSSIRDMTREAEDEYQARRARLPVPQLGFPAPPGRWRYSRAGVPEISAAYLAAISGQPTNPMMSDMLNDDLPPDAVD